MIKCGQATRGFTIVELLIVIVVIAILAAISIVAYNGIQQRATDSRVGAAIDAYAKGLSLYKVIHGEYPQKDQYTCLATIEQLPKTNDFEEGECMKGGVAPSFTVLQGLINDLKEHIEGMPDATTPTVALEGGLILRAPAYSASGDNAYIYVPMTSSNSDCIRGNKEDGSAVCLYTMD